MTAPLKIAVRFFRTSKRSMLLSSLGVIFGVGFFICGQAQTEGYQNFFVETILGSKGAITISDRFRSSYTRSLDKKSGTYLMGSTPQSRKYYPGIANAEQMIDVLMDYPNVEACSPILEDKVILRAGSTSQVCTLFGIDIPRHIATTDLPYQIIEGSFDDFRSDPEGLLVGGLLARKYDFYVGQSVNLTGSEGDSRRFRIAGIYETGVNVIDEKRIYVHQRPAQMLVRSPSLTSFILVRLFDPQRAPQDADAFEDLLQHRSRSWQEQEKGDLQIFRTLRISAGLAISAIILLAGFGIFNVLMMSVMEKTREIAILRSMGFSRQDIAAIFLWQGLLVAIIGILFGWAFGALLTHAVTFIPVRIRGIFKADYFIVSWSMRHYILAAVLALVSVFIAAFIPARRAAKLEPVDVLRGSAQ